MHFTFSVFCGYGVNNCDKAKNPYPPSLIVNVTIRLLVQSNAKITLTIKDGGYGFFALSRLVNIVDQRNTKFKGIYVIDKNIFINDINALKFGIALINNINFGFFKTFFFVFSLLFF